jgi:hypothetical protein
MRVMCVAPNFQNYGDLLTQVRSVATRYCVSVNNVPIVTYEDFVEGSKHADLENVWAIFLVLDNEFSSQYDRILEKIVTLPTEEVLTLGFVLGTIDSKMGRRLKKHGVKHFIGHIGHDKKTEKAHDFLRTYLPKVLQEERPIRQNVTIRIHEPAMAIA